MRKIELPPEAFNDLLKIRLSLLLPEDKMSDSDLVSCLLHGERLRMTSPRESHKEVETPSIRWRFNP